MLNRTDYLTKNPLPPVRKAAPGDACERCALTLSERQRRHGHRQGNCPLAEGVRDLCPESPLAGHYLHAQPKGKAVEK